MGAMHENPLYLTPKGFSPKDIKSFCDPDKGLHLYFRKNCLAMQRVFDDLWTGYVPVVFLHGNPHIDNFARYESGVGMVDFDRSRYGPFVWDLIRLLASITILQESGGSQVRDVVVDILVDAYGSSVKQPEANLPSTVLLSFVNPKKWQMSTEAYLDTGKKWAKHLNNNQIPNDSPMALELLKQYFKNRGEPKSALNALILTGEGFGTFGNRRFLYALDHRSDTGDHTLLEIKECYADSDQRSFFNPFKHHGLRMIAASKLYAPGVEQRMSWATVTDKGGEKHYWGRQILPFKAKMPKTLNKYEEEEVARFIGHQLGRAHGLSVLIDDRAEILLHLDKIHKQIKKTTSLLTEMTCEAHAKFQSDCEQVAS